MSGLNAFFARGEGQGIWVTGTWAIGLGNSTFTVICPPIKMKPLHPAVKWPLAIIISAVVTIPPALKFFREDPEVTRIKDYGAQANRYMEAARKRDSAQNNNR